MLYTRELRLSDEYPSIAGRKDRDRIFKRFAELLEEKLKIYLASLGYYRLASSVKVTPFDKGVIVQMLEYGKFIDIGTRPHIMLKHVNKTIPITLPDGRVIIRKVTMEAIAKGAWHHPGIKGLRFIDDVAKAVAEEYITGL